MSQPSAAWPHRDAFAQRLGPSWAPAQRGHRHPGTDSGAIIAFVRQGKQVTSGDRRRLLHRPPSRSRFCAASTAIFQVPHRGRDGRFDYGNGGHYRMAVAPGSRTPTRTSTAFIFITAGPTNLVWYRATACSRPGNFARAPIVARDADLLAERPARSFSLTRAAIEGLHPAPAASCEKPYGVAWSKVPYSLSWLRAGVPLGQRTRTRCSTTVRPFHFAGEHLASCAPGRRARCLSSVAVGEHDRQAQAGARGVSAARPSFSQASKTSSPAGANAISGSTQLRPPPHLQAEVAVLV